MVNFYTKFKGSTVKELVKIFEASGTKVYTSIFKRVIMISPWPEGLGHNKQAPTLRLKIKKPTWRVQIDPLQSAGGVLSCQMKQKPNCLFIRINILYGGKRMRLVILSVKHGGGSIIMLLGCFASKRTVMLRKIDGVMRYYLETLKKQLKTWNRKLKQTSKVLTQ